jgi:hypothetical protein
MAISSEALTLKLLETVTEQRHSKPENMFLSTHSLLQAHNGSRDASICSDSQEFQNSLHKFKFILKELRQELTNQVKNYNQALFDYEETIPRVDYDKLLQKYKKLEAEHEKISLKKKDLQNSIEKLNEIKLHVNIQYDKFSEQKKVLNNASTPRPDWNRCARVLDGGNERWSKIANGKSSDELVDVLLYELLGMSNENNKNEQKKIDKSKSSIGLKQKISNFEIFDEQTRSNKQIYNRSLNRRELGLAIHELWKAKINNDLSNRLNGKLKREKMNNFCVFYFNKKYNSPSLAQELLFNIKEACARFVEYEDARFLLMVLNNEIDEEIYHSFYESIGKLYLKLKTTNDNNIVTFEKVLKESYPNKTDNKISELIKAAIEDILEKHPKHHISKDVIDYKLLFMQNDDGKLGKFLKTFKNQYEIERIEFSRRITNKLDHLEHIYIADFIKCMKEEDGDVTNEQLNSYCEWIFNQTNCIEMKHQQYFIDKNDFLKKMQNVNKKN